MPKTVIEKSKASSSDVTVFSISGTLGFHEKNTLAKLFGECKKRDLKRVVLDVSGLTSLGGGCATIIHSQASEGFLVGVAGAKTTVVKFLNRGGEHPNVLCYDNVDDAVADLAGRSAEDAPVGANSGAEDAEPDGAVGAIDAADAIPTDGSESMHVDTVPAKAAAGERSETSVDPPGNSPKKESSPGKEDPVTDRGDADEQTRELQKRVVQLSTLFTINADFHRIHDKAGLLDVFLLTTIAQVGVENAAFLERSEGYFYPAAFKGVEPEEIRGFAINEELVDIDSWLQSQEIYELDDAPFSDEIKSPLLVLGCNRVAPFIVRGDIRAIVTLGPPIRAGIDDETNEFLKMLINQAAVAYESTRKFEEENIRTMGLVQTLISLIEENTLAQGNTNLVSNYTHAVAKKIHYPEEHVRDLIYGAVLRDIGMIKVSDLILRSPRELLPEEWEIIKRHPIEGAEMLRNMNFSGHVVDVVRGHHERFNGEGYPDGLQGPDIPLGARIVSVVESYGAMLQDRPNRPALSREESLNTIKENWGMRYDPEVVRVFVEIVEDEIRQGVDSNEKRFEILSL